MEQNGMKELAGRGAVDALVRPGMKLGLGTGSTAMPVVRRIGALIAEGKLSGIKAVSTSLQTSIECEKWGIPLYSLNSAEIRGVLDLTIDGADEVDPLNRCVKGGGGALLIEKITAYASLLFAVVVDATKTVEHLGMAFPVPVEVIPEARVPVTLALEKLGAEVTLREALRKAGPVITEHANIILDARFASPVDPGQMETALNNIPGVVENGFFTRVRPRVFIGGPSGTLEIRE